MSDLIENPMIRKYLEKSEGLFEEKKYLKSLTAIRDAFENAKHEKTKLLPIKAFLHPALIETKANMLNLHNFIQTVGEELEAYRLGVDMKGYNRFKEYLSHIPNNYGFFGMSRNWNEQDVRFCYDFATSAILLWQNEESEDSFGFEFSDKYEWQNRIGDIVIPRNTDEGFVSYSEKLVTRNTEEIHVFFVSPNLKNKLVKLKSEFLTSITCKIFKNGVLERVHTKSIIILGCSATLVVNNPEKWEVIIWWRNTSEIKDTIPSKTDKLIKIQ